MNTISPYVPALLFASLCVAGCSSPDGSPIDSVSSAAESNPSVAVESPLKREATDVPVLSAASVASRADDDAGAGYFACAADQDCVAVPYIERCCYNGWKIAVASGEAAAFQSTETCNVARPICPMYMVVDRRIPACNAATRSCEMVPPDAGSPVSPETAQ